MKSRIVLLVAGAVASALAQSPGTFTPTGNMGTPRAEHTATLLRNGKVLIAGGMTGALYSPLASAELYDPSTGVFTPTGAMAMARTWHTATLLAGGKVLIAGGRTGGDGSQDTGDAELYDPSTSLFSATGAMVKLRGLHSATLLADGRVLMTGCAFPCNSAIAELYDPSTGKFADAGPAGAGGMIDALLADGRVLIAGGCPAAGSPGTTAQLFDPSFDVFSFTGPMASNCGDIETATLLHNGTVLFVGNAENDGFSAEASLYDPVAGTFVSLGYTTGPHEFSTAAFLPDGTVLIAGGQLPGGSGDPGAELYTSSTRTFSLAGRMNTPRHSHTATLLPDGSVLIAGGFSVRAAGSVSAEIFRPAVLVRPPVLYSLSGDGSGQGAILHAGTAQIASSDRPAAAGDALEIYLAGLTDGSLIPPQVAIGGRATQVLWFGNAPGFPGLNQINVRVPAGVAAGAAVPVRITYLSRPSNEVTIGVR